MKRLTAAMFALVGIAVAALAMSLAAPKAHAAIPYCGHAYKTYVKTLPGGAVVFRISYAWGSTNFDHLHHYRIFRYKPVYPAGRWIFVRSLDRVCLNTHPV